METSPVVKPTLAIAVLTFRRPAPLSDLIPLLIEQARASRMKPPPMSWLSTTTQSDLPNPWSPSSLTKGSSTPMNLSPASPLHETVP